MVVAKIVTSHKEVPWSKNEFSVINNSLLSNDRTTTFVVMDSICSDGLRKGKSATFC